MRRKIYIILFSLFFSCSSNKRAVKIQEVGREFTGVITQDNLLETNNSTWFKPRYEAYEIEDTLISTFQKNLKNVKIKAFIGLWCGDSKREIPLLLKMLKQASFSEENIEIIAVDHKKKAKGIEKGYGVFRVPTFIFYKRNKELGRFVEFPVESLEKDVLKIISGKPYKHFYEE
ncbi:thiol-disulfide isomerase/thioredoxin [Tenacibaculum lutimaris]|uniref:Thiol-disulfide isomerase/thioredoxin n=3 Tax=Tenacibaculum TaxID=104267 RepID=A0A420DZI1_9FLAO|nr:thioredoxin family protein [Tenacibaculum discolor]RKF03250.1 thiol-disulfide isomerase/thioredoxin [Tenacibaculum lutimaris]